MDRVGSSKRRHLQKRLQEQEVGLKAEPPAKSAMNQKRFHRHLLQGVVLKVEGLLFIDRTQLQLLLQEVVQAQETAADKTYTKQEAIYPTQVLQFLQ